VSGGEDALIFRPLSEKEPLIIGLFCGKCPMKIRYPVRFGIYVLLETCKLEPSTCEHATQANIYMPET